MIDFKEKHLKQTRRVSAESVLAAASGIGLVLVLIDAFIYWARA